MLVICIVFEAQLQVLHSRNLLGDLLTVAVLQVKVGQELLQLLLRDRVMAHLVRRFAAHSLKPASICSPRSLQCSPNQGAVLQFFTALGGLLSRQPSYAAPGTDLPSASRAAGSTRPASGSTDEQQDPGTDILVEAAKDDDGKARRTEGVFGREGWAGSSSLSPGKQASWSAQGPLSSRSNNRRTQQQLSDDQDDGRPRALTRKAAMHAAFGFLVDPSQAVLLQLLEQCTSSAETCGIGSRHQRTSSFGNAAPEAVELRTQVLQLLAAVFRVPGRSTVTAKQITDHYVHYHFLHFAKLYTAQQHLDSHVLDLCRLHLAVLRSLAAHKVRAAGSPDLWLPAANLCRALACTYAMGSKLPVPWPVACLSQCFDAPLEPFSGHPRRLTPFIVPFRTAMCAAVSTNCESWSSWCANSAWSGRCSSTGPCPRSCCLAAHCQAPGTLSGGIGSMQL